MKNKLLFLLLIFQSSIIYSQIISDRPSQTASASVIRENHIQIETGILIEEIKSDINTLIRIGIFSIDYCIYILPALFIEYKYNLLKEKLDQF